MSPMVRMLPKSWLFPFPGKPCGAADTLEGKDSIRRNLERWRSELVLSRGIYRAGVPLLWRHLERAVVIKPEKEKALGSLRTPSST